MSEKKYKEITGTILNCAVGYRALIVTGDKLLSTSPVKSIIMVHQNKLYFQTENSNYVVNYTHEEMNLNNYNAQEEVNECEITINHILGDSLKCHVKNINGKVHLHCPTATLTDVIFSGTIQEANVFIDALKCMERLSKDDYVPVVDGYSIEINNY